MRRSDRGAFILGGVGLVVILGGVQVVAWLDDAPAPPAPESEFCPDRPNGAARPDTGYREAAEPYRGDGPHPVYFDLRHVEFGRVDIPDGWKAGSDGAQPRPRLIACVYRDDTTPPQEIRTRLYSSYVHAPDLPVDTRKAQKVPLLKAGYVIGLYEAKTATPVGRIQVPGADRCPMHYRPDSGTSIFQEPDTRKLHAALRPYVERSVGA
ncbi:hypothetical protein ACFY4C_23335 [Actinomadura viridis]|uniref:hypothetical protein n=1 Tax=Actinomadura viridis TaxID=58110 RepID=UPI00368B1D81